MLFYFSDETHCVTFDGIPQIDIFLECKKNAIKLFFSFLFFNSKTPFPTARVQFLAHSRLKAPAECSLNPRSHTSRVLFRNFCSFSRPHKTLKIYKKSLSIQRHAIQRVFEMVVEIVGLASAPSFSRANRFILDKYTGRGVETLSLAVGPRKLCIIQNVCCILQGNLYLFLLSRVRTVRQLSLGNTDLGFWGI